ncbi:phenylacetate-CoA oxygenase subunit PaaC [Enterobacteriaceae bacterium 4M9]|nr:phenylacetate-CoA oxygenase subunit PaaC [Enterobacteriaceae bacterium 4M9]
MNPIARYSLRLGDSCLILSQRLCAWCGHAPELEIDLALANIGLDLLGQGRNFLTYAAELQGEGSEDTLAYQRDEREYSNLLLAEQPNGEFSDTLVRQYLLDAWHVVLFSQLVQSRDATLAAIAAKAIKEARYHLRFSRGWLVRLGNGTDFSHGKMQQALDNLWRFTAELFDADELDISLAQEGIAVDPRTLRAAWQQEVEAGLREAGLDAPEDAPYRTGGRNGRHTEHLGPLLAEMQYLARSFPGLSW